MDFIFCCLASSHVSVDTVHPSLLRSSSSPPMWYHLQSFFLCSLGLASSRTSKPPQSCFSAPPCDILYLQSLSLVSSFLNITIFVLYVILYTSSCTWDETLRPRPPPLPPTNIQSNYCLPEATGAGMEPASSISSPARPGWTAQCFSFCWHSYKTTQKLSFQHRSGTFTIKHDIQNILVYQISL